MKPQAYKKLPCTSSDLLLLVDSLCARHEHKTIPTSNVKDMYSFPQTVFKSKTLITLLLHFFLVPFTKQSCVSKEARQVRYKLKSGFSQSSSNTSRICLTASFLDPNTAVVYRVEEMEALHVLFYSRNLHSQIFSYVSHFLELAAS